MSFVLTTAEVAKLLNVSTRRVRAMKSQLGGRLQGRDLIYSRFRVMAVVEKRRKAGLQ